MPAYQKAAELVSRYRVLETSGLTLLALSMTSTVVAAQDGWCSVPGGEWVIGTLGMLLTGGMVLAGMFGFGYGAALSRSGGSSRGVSARMYMLGGAAAMIVGFLLPAIVGWIGSGVGVTLADRGLGCMFA